MQRPEAAKPARRSRPLFDPGLFDKARQPRRWQLDRLPRGLAERIDDRTIVDLDASICAHARQVAHGSTAGLCFSRAATTGAKKLR